MTPPAISVVIPTFRSAAFIERTLESVFAQTALPTEVVVVDDRSPDGTAEAVRRAARHAPVPVRLVELPANTGGPATPLNVGVGAVRTRYVATLDHDDWMEPDKLRLQLAALARHPAAGLCFGDSVWFRGHDPQAVIPGKVRSPHLDGYDPGRPHHLLPANVLTCFQVLDSAVVLSCSNLVFPKAVWERFGPFDRGHNPICDYLFKLKVCGRRDAVYVPRVLFRKAQHLDNLFDKSHSPALFATIRDAGAQAVAGLRTLRGVPPGVARQAAQELFDQAYTLSREGRHARAARLYAAHLRLFGPSARTLRGLAGQPLLALRAAGRGGR